ncbi:MAG: hypothetical protein LBL66_05210 [Clostridiales bacterium]|jgi:hypothetical protein|nr:hypothetical protein [Clostridiales bacterium]
MDGQIDDIKLKDVFLKRALGFYSEDVTEEYENDETGERLVKRKVNRKFNLPDLSALRELLGKEAAGLAEMSDAELERERERLISELRSEMHNSQCTMHN